MMASAIRHHSERFNSRNRFEHEVFLSFRGEDVRNGFEGHLFNALRWQGFRTFQDNDGLEHGKDIQSKLYEAIEKSELSIVTLSPGYADSRWCLNELVRIMELKNLHHHMVLPVFFDVEPTDVRHQTESYRKAFEVHSERFGGETDMVKKWREALTEIAALRGLSLKEVNGHEAQLIQNILKEVRKIVVSPKQSVPHYIVGVDFEVQHLCSWLTDGSQDVEMGLIYGLGGVGKTTIAKIVYNLTYDKFDGHSFLADFGRGYEQDNKSRVRLQKQLIADISGKLPDKIHNVSAGMVRIREVIGLKKILLVLDDVEELEQLGGVLDHPEWFYPGSKVIITTRNQQLRKVHMLKQEFKVTRLNDKYSTMLFSLLVFDQDLPLNGYETLSQRFVDYCGGLPLTLYVVAPLLRGEEDKEIWESQLDRLERYPNQTVQAALKLSFDSMKDDDDRNLFLHIACFFVGIDADYAIKILKACKVYTKHGLQYLVDKCLVTVSEKLGMHRLIQEMGREIVRQEAINEPGRRSRLWDHETTLKVLRNDKGTNEVRGLSLNFPTPKGDASTKQDEFMLQNILKRLVGLAKPPQSIASNLESIRTKAFRNMKMLNLLRLSYVQLEGDYEDFPKSINWLWWQGCPLKSLPLDMDLNEVAVIDMQNSYLLNPWEGSKCLSGLRILNLSHSLFIRSTPDFSNALGLEQLLLEDCVNLTEIHESIGSLSKLTDLNLKGCNKLTWLPITITKLSSIQRLDLSGCSCLLADDIDRKRKRNVLSSLSRVRRSHFRLTHFTSLVSVSLRDCGIANDALFEDLRSLPSLMRLDLSHNPIRVINKNLDCFNELTHLYLNYCESLQSVSNLPRSLYEISVVHCLSLESIGHRQIQWRSRNYLISATVSPKLVEIEGLLKLEDVKDLDVNMARYMGYSYLNTLRTWTKGLYYNGQYNIYLFGDHISKWFQEIRYGLELYYIVPLLPDCPIRAVNICCVIESRGYNVVDTHYTKIINLTSKCTWSNHPRIAPPGRPHDGTLTFLSHWSVMQHREVRAGDELHIKFGIYGTKVEKCGIKIVYEEDNEGMKSHEFSFLRGSERDVAIEHGRERGAIDIAARYHDNFRNHDLSLYQSEGFSQIQL